ncbi:MAG TPA: hypothetical protein H9776_05795 [Candidatus Mediterraneibacter intestinipullorum]|nr:hypothetical protein [Candidatus Mediterraneibacter intestinipullorum]
MTSVKCFINWIREAGRGHLAAFLGWGTMLVYSILSITRLSFDTDYTYFGMGSTELSWLGAGLGLVLAFLEFFYLLQQKKQDFYYSLPVKKSTVFWGSYVHGLIHSILPLALAMASCGIFQSAVDVEFAAFAWSYTGKSFLVTAGVFLIFYHMGMLCITVCGNVLSSLVMCGVFIFYFRILVGNAFTTFASGYFQTYYRIPLLEKMTAVLSPFSLAEALTGRDVYEKPLVLRFMPGGGLIAASLVWILLLLLLAACARRRRKTERTGRIFAVLAAERMAETGISFLAGVWAAGFVLDVSGLMETSRLTAGISAAGISAIVAAAVHCLLEIVLKNPGAGFLRRKWQLVISCALAVAVCIMFPAGASSYDSYFPGEAASVGISIDGLGMSYDVYLQVQGNREDYETDDRLVKYTLTGEGKSAALGWLQEVVQDSGGSTYTWATVCYHLEDGSEHYRTYPLTREEVEAFAAVYETAEYKQIAYPAVNLAEVGEDRFTWDDGVTGNGMKLTAEDKAGLVEAYREDVAEFEMNELTTVLPAGSVKIRSSKNGKVTEMVVYPFFERTCSILAENDVDLAKTLKDYPVESVEVRESLFSAPRDSAGGVSTSFYEEQEEVAEWKEKLVPYELDLQPLLHPLDHSKEIKAVIEETETNSLISVDCAMMPGK